MVGIDGRVFNRPPKKRCLTVALQNCREVAVKHSIEEFMLPNFLDLSTIFFPRMSDKTYLHL